MEIFTSIIIKIELVLQERVRGSSIWFNNVFISLPALSHPLTYCDIKCTGLSTQFLCSLLDHCYWLSLAHRANYKSRTEQNNFIIKLHPRLPLSQCSLLCASAPVTSRESNYSRAANTECSHLFTCLTISSQTGRSLAEGGRAGSQSPAKSFLLFKLRKFSGEKIFFDLLYLEWMLKYWRAPSL